MTDKKKFKARVRERMARTGESYTTAKRNLEAEGDMEPTDADGEVDTGASIFKKRYSTFRQQSLDEWRQLIGRLSGSHNSSWTSAAEIAAVLSQVGSDAPRNHTLFPPPGGGGLDLVDSALSHEAGCVELIFENQAAVVRPVSLQLCLPDRDPLREWSYFWLETGTLSPSGVYKHSESRDEEYVLELSPGEYVSSDFWEQRYYGSDENGDPLELPPDARLLSRRSRGSFLLMAKGTTYMSIDRYVGDHGTMSAVEFKHLIQRLVDRMHEKGIYGKDLRHPND